MSLTNCMRKIGNALGQVDRIAILERARELRNSGTANGEASRQAVREQLLVVRDIVAAARRAANEPRDANLKGSAAHAPEAPASMPQKKPSPLASGQKRTSRIWYSVVK